MADPFQNNITTLAKRLKPFIMSSAGLVDASHDAGIILYHPGGIAPEYYPATQQGLTDAIAAAASGDQIWIPAASIGGNHTIPAGVGVIGVGQDKTILTGAITVNGVMQNLTVNGSASPQVTLTSGFIRYCRLETSGNQVLDQNGGKIYDSVLVGAYQNIAYAWDIQGAALAFRVQCDGGGVYVGVDEAQAVLYCTSATGTGNATAFVIATGTVAHCHARVEAGIGYQKTGSGTAALLHSSVNRKDGETGTDLSVLSGGTLEVYSVNYETSSIAGTLTYLNGDRMAVDGSGGGGASGETNTTISVDGPLMVGGDMPGALEGVALVGLYEGSNPVIPCGAGAASDLYIREIGNVLYEPTDSEWPYKAFYTGYNAGANTDEKIHLARSKDGHTWTKYASNPVISARAEDAYVVKVNGIYYLYAEDKAGGATDIKRWQSTDCLTWTNGTIVLEPSAETWEDQDVTSPIVWMEGATWYMLYEGRGSVSSGIGLATSIDGLTWTREASNPVMVPGDVAWVSGDIVCDDVKRADGTYYMTYHGYDGSEWGEGLANSTDLLTWTDEGRFTHSDLTHIDSCMLVYDTRWVFYYYLDDSSGIYRGYPYPPILTISGGTVTITSDWHIIAAESGTTDDLATISGGVAGQFLLIQPDSGDTITVKHGTGNIYLNGEEDFVLDGEKSLLLFFDGTNWSDIGAGGGSSSHYELLQDEDGNPITDENGEYLYCEVNDA
jgi:predicted GH43/DUF377 family glycosyl hydrolase